MIKKILKKLREYWRQIPLQVRVVFNLILIAAILALPIYILYYEWLFAVK